MTGESPGIFFQPTEGRRGKAKEIAGAKDKLVRERDNKISEGGEIQR